MAIIRGSYVAGLAVAATVAAIAAPAAAMPTPARALARVGGSLNAVAAVSATDAWAVGASNALHPQILHWNGAAWTKVSGLAKVKGQLFGVAASSARDAWAVGSRVSGGTLILHWNGTNWAVVTSPGNFMLLSVAADSARDAWAVGTIENANATRKAAPILHWNGVAWVRMPVSLARGADLTSVAASSASNVWAVGQGSAGPLILHWTGRRWTETIEPVRRGSLYGVATTSAGSAFAAGVGFGARPAGCAGSCPLTLRWSGGSWRAEPSANPASQPRGNWLFAVAAAAGGAWAVGGTSVTSAGGGTFILRREAGRWLRVPSPLETGGTNLFGVAATSADNAWAVGYTTQTTPFLVVILRWNGTRWTRVL